MLTCPGNLVVICQNKYKVFFWLLIKDRFSTRNILTRKKKHGSIMIVNSAARAVKKLLHTFLSMSFGNFLLGSMQVQIQAPTTIFEVINSLKRKSNTPIFMNIITLLCRTIWTAKNDLIFQGVQPSIAVVTLFQEGTRPAHASSTR